MTLVDKNHDRRRRPPKRVENYLEGGGSGYTLTKEQYDERHRNAHDIPEPGRGTPGPPPPPPPALPDITVERLVELAPALERVVDQLRGEQFADLSILRLLLSGDSDRRRGLSERVVEHLDSVGGSISSIDGTCIPYLARVLYTTVNPLRDILAKLDADGRITRTVDNGGTFRVTLL